MCYRERESERFDVGSMCKVSIHISLLFYYTRFIMCLECMFKGVWWWDLNKDNKLVANFHAKNPQNILSIFPSIEWFLLKIQDWHWFFGQSQDLCPSRMCLNYEGFIPYRMSCLSCDLLAKVKITSCPSTSIMKLFKANGSHLTGIIKLILPKSRLSWFRVKG